MGISKTLISNHPSLPFSQTPFPILLLLFLYLLPLVSSADLYSLVYKGCANQTFSTGGSGASQQTLASLASALVAQSSTSKFYKTTAASSSSQPIFGLFQCRGDLSPSDCSACVVRLLPEWTSLCGAAVAARVQLTGCYALYQLSGFPQVSGTQMLFKTCGSGGGGGGFEVKRDTAFASLQSGIASSAGGFYATSYQSVYAMALCEGDLSTGDCGECVAQAVQRAEVECGGANFGQVYLDKCYISYSYYPNGVPRGGGGGGGSGGGGGGGYWLV